MVLLSLQNSPSSDALVTSQFNNSHNTNSNLITKMSPHALVNFETSQCHEDDPAEICLTCPPALSSFMLALHPEGALYEKPFDVKHAKAQHEEFRRVLTDMGCKVFTVADVLLANLDDTRYRVELEELAFSRLNYVIATDSEPLSDSDKQLLTDDYKRKVIESFSPEALVDVIMTNPTVYLSKATHNTPLVTKSVGFNPLGNMTYTRDQQITTAKGVVMGRFNSSQRAQETDILEYVLNKLGAKVIGRVPAPGLLEGGDFIACGDVCMVGIGLRSNYNAIKYLLDNDLWGCRRLAVVKDIFDRDQDRMHLDCTCNILTSTSCVITEDIIGEGPHMRLVDEYTYVDGHYKLTRTDVEFSKYLGDLDINMIPVDPALQLLYGVNVVNIGDGRIVNVNQPASREMVSSPYFDGSVHCIKFDQVTAGYGSVHCATQILSRRRTQRTIANDKRLAEKPVIPDTKKDYFVVAPTALYDLMTSLPADEARPEQFKGLARKQLQKDIRDEFFAACDALYKQGKNLRIMPYENWMNPETLKINNWVQKSADGVQIVKKISDDVINSVEFFQNIFSKVEFVESINGKSPVLDIPAMPTFEFVTGMKSEDIFFQL